MKRNIALILIIILAVNLIGQISRFKMDYYEEEQDNKLLKRYPVFYYITEINAGFYDGITYAHDLFNSSNIYKRLFMRTGILVESFPRKASARSDPYYFGFRKGYYNVFNFSSIEKILIVFPIIEGFLFITFLILDWIYFY